MSVCLYLYSVTSGYERNFFCCTYLRYQGENNCGALKGQYTHGLGYSCEQAVLIKGWREIWSQTPGTTDPQAPFGVVTLASSGAEGADSEMGTMRIAQTVYYKLYRYVE